MNEGCIGIRRLADPEIELIGREIGRSKPLFSRSADHPISRSNDFRITRSTDQRGFTLFEVLISITLTGLLMLALLIGLRVANRAWRTGEARLRLVHAEAERDAFVVRQISSLVPYRITSSDPNLPGRFTVLQASATCLRFISSYSSVYRSRTGLVLVEYGIVAGLPGNVEVALRETPVADNDILYHKIVLSVTNDPDTGLSVINYQPFSPKATDLRLMTGLTGAWFAYLDLHPKKGAFPWRTNWLSSDEKPYPDAIRLHWERGNQSGDDVMPLRAKLIPPSAMEMTQ